MIEVREYIDRAGQNHFGKWFAGLPDATQARVAVYLTRLGNGNFSVAKAVGSGVFELRLDFGPGFRVYCGQDGETLVILLAGGSKKRQSQTIKAAQLLWQEYKSSKREK